MLKNIKPEVLTPQVLDLLGYAAYADTERTAKAAALYRDDASYELHGYIEENEGDEALVGLIGSRLDEEGRLVIHHIAVEPDYRDQGYGRMMILKLLAEKEPKLIVAETDEDAADFYRNIGFTVESLGEAHPGGAERFRCIYDTALDDEFSD